MLSKLDLRQLSLASAGPQGGWGKECGGGQAESRWAHRWSGLGKGGLSVDLAFRTYLSLCPSASQAQSSHLDLHLQFHCCRSLQPYRVGGGLPWVREKYPNHLPAYIRFSAGHLAGLLQCRLELGCRSV